MNLSAIIFGGVVIIITWLFLPPLDPPAALLNKVIVSFDILSADVHEAVVGNFIVKWTNDQRSLTVFHKDDLQEAVWETAPGREFVFAAETQWHVFEKHGSFDVKESTAVCSGQVIDTITTTNGEFQLNGHLSFCSPPVSYTLRFAPTSPGSHLELRLELCEPFANATDPAAECVPYTGPKWSRVFLSSASTEEEAFFGFGMQFSFVNLKGRRLPILTNEQGVGRGTPYFTPFLKAYFGMSPMTGTWHTTYSAIPQYVTSRNRCFFLHNTEYTVFDLRPAYHTMVEPNSTSLHAHIVYGTSTLDVLEALTEHTGRMVSLPPWLQDGGAVVGLQGGSDVVRRKVADLQAAGVPVIAVWLQDWVGKRLVRGQHRLWWNWEPDPVSYPDWEDFVAEMRGTGVEVLTYINPHLTDVSSKAQYTNNLFAQALEKGILVKHCDGTLVNLSSFGFRAGLIDLTHPDGRAFMLELLRAMIRGGVRGWMADFSEGLPFDACLYNGTGKDWHNRYPELWASINMQAVREAEMEKEVFFFNRASTMKSQGDSYVSWIGDQLTAWNKYDGLATVVPACLSGGFSGISQTHSDIGGYTAAILGPVNMFVRTKELFMRWCELAAFTAVYRTHEGTQPAANWQVDSDKETTHFFGAFAKVHVALNEYRAALLQASAARGLPIMRHMYMHFPSEATVDLTTQFMLGEALLVAPVVERYASALDVFLPNGCWTRVLFGPDAEKAGVLAEPICVQARMTADRGATRGQWMTVHAPLGHPAVFYNSEHADVGLRLQRRLRDLLWPTCHPDHDADTCAAHT